MFKYDPKKLPYVKFKESWKLQQNTRVEIYEAGGWDFELIEDERLDEIEHAQRSIYAWIAWYEFLRRRAENGTETKS